MKRTTIIEIENDLRVRDTAFVLYGGKIRKFVITAINLRLEWSGRNISNGMPHKPNVIIKSYDMLSGDPSQHHTYEFNACEVFATKEDLLNSLESSLESDL